MSKKTKVLANQLLTELNGNNSQFFDSLNTLLEILENKPEPNQSEIHLTTLLYQFVEVSRLLEAHLKEYSIDKKTISDTLSSLYDQCTGYGSSKLFNM